MDRRPPPWITPDVILLPRLGPRLGCSLLFPVMLVGAVWAAATSENIPVMWLGFLVGSFLFMEAWLGRVVICGPVLYQRGPFRWSEPLRAEEVEEVTLHYNPGRFDWFRRDLMIITRNRRGRAFSARWWLLAPLVAWLARHCTRVEEGQLVWAVKTDEKTRSRLEPYARKHLADPAKS